MIATAFSSDVLTRRWARVSVAAREHGRSAAVLGALLIVTGVFHAVGMHRNPQVVDDEGTYVAQAWAILELGELAHYTYWYDHPPLGWIQLALFAALTGGFDRVESSIEVGRQFMLFVNLVSVGLLWTLCRRLGFARWSAALAVLVFGLSPLAVQFHRVVFLDNIATPWILAAFVLAASPRQRLADVAGAGICFGVAVLTKETTLLLLPPLIWMLWDSTDRTTRRYTLAVGSSLLTAIGISYLLFAIVKGELVPGSDRVSLWEGMAFQLSGRESGGSILESGTANRRTVDLWLGLDGITPLLALAATPIALAVRRLRPIAVGTTVMAVMLSRPGYLPVPFVIAAIPFMAVVIAGVVETAWSHRPRQSAAPTLRDFGSGTVLAGASVALLAAVPLWAVKHRGLLLSDPNRPVEDATEWLSDNVPRDHRLIVDDVFWVDLVSAGFPRDNVVWAYKVDTDPEVEALAPRGWQDYDYLVVTEGIRQATDSGTQVALAEANSVVVARFGQDEERVEVRRITESGGGEGSPNAQDADTETRLRSTLGSAIVTATAMDADDSLAELLKSGGVDRRLLTVLAAATSTWDLRLQDLPEVYGEEGIGLRRVAIVEPADPAAAAEIRSWIADQTVFAVTVAPTADGLALSVPPRPVDGLDGAG